MHIQALKFKEVWTNSCPENHVLVLKVFDYVSGLEIQKRSNSKREQKASYLVRWVPGDLLKAAEKNAHNRYLLECTVATDTERRENL